jgi:hypothetical protein
MKWKLSTANDDGSLGAMAWAARKFEHDAARDEGFLMTHDDEIKGWITLPEAAAIAARMAGIDEVIAAEFESSPTRWPSTARCALQRRGSEPRNAAEAEEARKAIDTEIAKADGPVKALARILSSGKVSGIGSRVQQPVAPITGDEWATRYINFWEGRLEPRFGSWPDSFPTISDVRVKIDELRRALRGESGISDNPMSAAKPKVAKRTATLHVIAEFLRSRFLQRQRLPVKQLQSLIEKERPDIGKVSETTTRRAMREAWPGEQSRQTRSK